jgi:hypothetical protein
MNSMDNYKPVTSDQQFHKASQLAILAALEKQNSLLEQLITLQTPKQEPVKNHLKMAQPTKQEEVPQEVPQEASKVPSKPVKPLEL